MPDDKVAEIGRLYVTIEPITRWFKNPTDRGGFDTHGEIETGQVLVVIENDHPSGWVFALFAEGLVVIDAWDFPSSLKRVL